MKASKLVGASSVAASKALNGAGCKVSRTDGSDSPLPSTGGKAHFELWSIGDKCRQGEGGRIELVIAVCGNAL